MNDNTRIRIKVPAHLYESVKKKLTLKEGKGNFSGGAYTETVKEKKAEGGSNGPSSPKPKSDAAPKSKAPSSKTEETPEKTLEERVAALEELLDSYKKKKEEKTKKEGFEDEIGYSKGEQHPDKETSVPKSTEKK
jgi:hypothetical protein